MKISQYIIVKKKDRYSGSNGYFSSRMTQTAPSLEANEVAVKVELTLPDEIFTKPAFQASITVPKEAVSQPVIEASVIDNVQKIIKQNTGFEVKLQVVEVEKKKTK